MVRQGSANAVAARFPISSIPGQSSNKGWNDNTIGSPART